MMISAVAKCFFVVMVSFAGISPVFATGGFDYSEIKAAVESAYRARADLLNNSTGAARLMIEKKAPLSVNVEDLKKEFSKDFGFSPESLRFTGRGEWTTTWYRKGLKNRYDVNVPSLLKGKNELSPPFLVPRNMRIAVDPEKGNYYDVKNKKAYINQPPVRATNPYGLVINFDIHRLYQFNNRDLPDLLAGWDKEGVESRITEDKVGQIYCIKLEFNWEKMYPNNVKRKKRLELWIVPQMSYSLVKAQFFGNRKTQGKQLVLLESYEADYEESKEFKGIWLLKDVKIRNNQGRMNETLIATFQNTKVGVEIPDKTFTFEGLGVPPGTKIYDKSLGGQPLQYYYKSFPIGKVDELAEEILTQEKEKDKGQSEKTVEKVVAQEAAQNISPDQEQTKPNAIIEPAAETTKSSKNKSHLWVLYWVLAMGIGAILVVVYRRFLVRNRERTQRV